MADDLTPDICVIGAGPGGLAAEIGAAREGVPVVLIEKNRLGGAYYCDGAVASKALAAAAESRAGACAPACSVGKSVSLHVLRASFSRGAYKVLN